MSGQKPWAILAIPAILFGLQGCGQEAGVSYAAQIKPILAQHCAECHLDGGEGTRDTGFLVTTYEAVMKGTIHGPVIVPGDALSSSFYRLVAGLAHPSIQMPHTKEPITAEQIRLVERWIEQGAPNN